MNEKPEYLDDPEYWRAQASEARAMAQLVVDPENKRLMLAIAEGYHRLALLKGQRATARDAAHRQAIPSSRARTDGMDELRKSTAENRERALSRPIEVFGPARSE